MSETGSTTAKTIEFTVDGEDLVTTERVLTPVQVMDLAGIDPANHYLSEIRGHDQISFKDDPTVEIHMHEGIKFVSASTGPTPTS